MKSIKFGTTSRPLFQATALKTLGPGTKPRMSQRLSRKEAEEFAAGYKASRIYLDEPSWPECKFEPLVALWHERRPGLKALPGRADIDLLNIPGLVPLIQIFQLVSTPGAQDEARVVYQGSSLSANTREETGTLAFTDDVVSEKIQLAYRDYLSFITRWDQPIWVDVALAEWQRKTFQMEKYVSVPLSTDGVTIDGALTASYFYQPTNLSLR